MNNTFWKTLWNSFQDVNGGVLSFLGILISVIVSRFPAKTQIPLDINIIIGTFVLLILGTLTRALITTLEELETLARDSHIYKIPRIKVVKPSSFGKIYLAEYSRLISKDTFVSLYYLDGEGASQKCKFIELGALNFQIPGISKMPGILYRKC